MSDESVLVCLFSVISIDPTPFQGKWSSQYIEDLNVNSNFDLYDTGALHLSNQVNRELGVMWVHDKPVDNAGHICFNLQFKDMNFVYLSLHA